VKRIKHLGLAVFAALALTAVVGTAGAAAAEFEVESEASLSSTGSGHLLQFHTSSTECIAPALGGTLGAHSLTAKVTAKDSKCTAFGVTGAMTMNGCEFVLRPGAMQSETTSKGALDIACAAGKTISISATPCNVTIPAQNNLAATFENVGEGKARSIKVNLAATALKHSQVSGSGCKESLGEFSDGKWTGNWTLSGSGVGIWVKSSGGFELPPAGIGINGSQLVAGAYPTSITGSQKTTFLWKFSGGSAECASSTLSSSISAATNQFAVQGSYGACTAIGVVATTAMNGCSYTFNVLSNTTGHADIACPAGKAIEITASKCTITIPAQTTDSEGLSFTNESSTSTIGLGFSIKGIDYHQQQGTGIGKCTTGDYTNGTYSGTSTLVGSY
jgi:hypothetical protein